MMKAGEHNNIRVRCDASSSLMSHSDSPDFIKELKNGGFAHSFCLLVEAESVGLYHAWGEGGFTLEDWLKLKIMPANGTERTLSTSTQYHILPGPRIQGRDDKR